MPAGEDDTLRERRLDAQGEPHHGPHVAFKGQNGEIVTTNHILVGSTAARIETGIGAGVSRAAHDGDTLFADTNLRHRRRIGVSRAKCLGLLPRQTMSGGEHMPWGNDGARALRADEHDGFVGVVAESRIGLEPRGPILRGPRRTAGKEQNNEKPRHRFSLQEAPETRRSGLASGIQ